MQTDLRYIGFFPAQPGGFVVTLDQEHRTNEYPLKCWVLVEDDDPDPEIEISSHSMLGCFSIAGDIVDAEGNLNLVPRIGLKEFLPGEKFLEYKFKEPGLD